MLATNNQLPWFLDKDSQYVYLQDDYVCFDLETTNLDKGSALNKDNRIVLACWTVVKDGAETIKYKFGDEYEQQELLDDIKSVKYVVAQGAKFDLQWLTRCGADLRDLLVYDTMLGEWVLDGNLRQERNLSALGDKYLGIGKKADLVTRLIKQGVCPSKIPQAWLLKYCLKDVQLCKDVFVLQREVLKKREQLHIVHVRNLTCLVLADIEFNGMTLDKDAVLEEYKKTSIACEKALHKLNQMAEGVNFNSPKQLAELLYDKMGFEELRDRKGKLMRTEKGARATSSDVMANLVAITEQQELFVRTYRTFSKMDSLLSKNLVFFQKVCEELDGKFYGIFNQNIAATHRLSASGRPLLFKEEKKTKQVQFQNLPREYKRLFTVDDDDYLIGEVDGAQLEFRVAADLCRDNTAYEEIVNEVDIHSFTAKVMTEAGEPTDRQSAKRMTFKPLFGGQSGTKAEKDYIEFFTNKYEGIATEQRTWTYKVLNNKHLRTRYGMMFFWPHVNKSRSGYISDTTNIYNFPIQGFATAEIIPIALIHFWHKIKGLRVWILNTIHDSIICKVHKDDVEEYERIAKEALTTDVFRFLREVYSYDFVVPLGAGIKVGKNWGTSKTEKVWNVFPDGRETYKLKE